MITHGIITGALFLLRRRDLRAHPRPDDRQDGRPRRRDAGLRRDLRLLRAASSLACPAWPASSASSWCSSAVRLLPVVARRSRRFVMILGAAYLLWMYQRVVFGDLSDFLKGLGHHLTDIDPIEVADARAAGRAGRRLRPLPGPAARPRPGPVDRRPDAVAAPAVDRASLAFWRSGDDRCRPDHDPRPLAVVAAVAARGCDPHRRPRLARPAATGRS